jgi:hypothetical protein
MMSGWREKVKSAVGGMDGKDLAVSLGVTAQKMNTGALSESMAKFDPNLAVKVKGASDAKEAFMMIAGAAAKEGDAVRRADMLTAAFGKTGRQMAAKLGGLSDVLEDADKFGGMLSPRTINMADKFGSVMTDVKFILQGFSNVAKAAMVEHIAPLIAKFREWAGANREVIASRISAFVGSAAKAIKAAIPAVQSLWKLTVGTLTAMYKHRHAIIALAVAFKSLKAIDSVNTALKTLKTMHLGANAAIAAAPKLLGATNTSMIALNGTMAVTGKTLGGVSGQMSGMAANTARMPGLFGRLAASIGGVTIGIVGLVAATVIGVNWLIAKNYEAREAAIADKYGLTKEEMEKEVNPKAQAHIEKRAKAVTEKESTLASLKYQRDSALNMGDRAAAAKFDFPIKQTELWLKENPRIEADNKSLDAEREKFAAEYKRKKDENDPYKKLLEEIEALLAKSNDDFEDYASEFSAFADKTSPANLRWNKMGLEDFYETQRLGV